VAIAATGLVLALVTGAIALDRVTTRVSTGPLGGNGAFAAGLVGASEDGKRVIIATAERLTADDTDAQYDLYERTGAGTTLVSTGPTGGNGAFDPQFSGASADGTRVFFLTDESLTPDDTDAMFDTYERADGTTTRLSAGAVNGNGAFEGLFVRASTDGARVFFRSSEPLTADDLDTRTDVFQRAGGVTTRVTTGAGGGNGDFSPTLRALSADGTHAFFDTSEVLAATDTDTEPDIYERAGGVTTQVSQGAINGNGSFNSVLAAVSADGSRVLFVTQEPLTSDDTDAVTDLYQRASGVTTLVSTGPAGGNGAFQSEFGGNSVDLSRILFATQEKLTADDTDAQYDVYERAGGTTTRLSTGPGGGSGAFSSVPAGTTPDGSHVFFRTAEQMTLDDIDAKSDLYERAGGVTTRVSAGPLDGGNGAFDAFFAGVSDDGARVFFETGEALTADDTDLAGTCLTFAPPGEPCRDLYERAGGQTTLLSGPYAGGGGAVNSRLAAASSDGNNVLFTSTDQITPDDTDALLDVFAAGPVPPAGPASSPDTLAPTVSSFGMSRKRFRVGHARTPTAAKRKRRRTKVGTSFRYRLSEAASVRIVIQRRAKGRRVHGRCRKPTRKLRARKRCVRWLRKGTLTRAGKQGRNSHRFSGRIGRRALRPGRYRASLTATDKAGNRSRAKRVRFRIVRR
jgi:hypothetical protein